MFRAASSADPCLTSSILSRACVCVQVSASFMAVEKDPLHFICNLPSTMQDRSPPCVCFCFAGHFFLGKFQVVRPAGLRGRAKRGGKRSPAAPLPYEARGTGSSSCWMRRRRRTRRTSSQQDDTEGRSR